MKFVTAWLHLSYELWCTDVKSSRSCGQLTRNVKKDERPYIDWIISSSVKSVLHFPLLMFACLNFFNSSCSFLRLLWRCVESTFHSLSSPYLSCRIVWLLRSNVLSSKWIWQAWRWLSKCKGERCEDRWVPTGALVNIGRDHAYSKSSWRCTNSTWERRRLSKR